MTLGGIMRLVTAGLALAVLVPVAASAPEAVAAPPHHRLVRSTALDRCPGTASICQSAKAVERLPKGARLALVCSTSGRGGSWLLVKTSDAHIGFVPAKRVGGSPAARPCSADHAVSAALWTTDASVWGAVHPTDRMKATLNRAYDVTYDFGDDNDWSGDSRAFGALAYLANGKSYKIPLTNPIDTFNAYKAQGKVHTTGAPPIGALVFWHHVSYGYEYGLLGISLGNRRAVTPDGFDDSALPVGLKTTKGSMGWVLPY